MLIFFKDVFEGFFKKLINAFIEPNSKYFTFFK